MATIKKGVLVVELKRTCTKLPCRMRIGLYLPWCVDDYDLRVLAPKFVIKAGTQAISVTEATVADSNPGGYNVTHSSLREFVMSIGIFCIDVVNAAIHNLCHSGRENKLYMRQSKHRVMRNSHEPELTCRLSLI